MWKKHKHVHFFLAGAVIGKVENIYTLADQHGVEKTSVDKFLKRYEIMGLPLTERDKMMVARSIYRWAREKKIPQNIFEVLKRIYEEKLSTPFGELEYSENPQYKFFDDVVNEQEKNEANEADKYSWLDKNNIEKIERMKPFERDMFVNVVSRSASARQYERALRTMYEQKMLVLTAELPATDMDYINKDVEHFYEEKIENAKTADEIYQLWLNMKLRNFDLEEILESVNWQMEHTNDEIGEYWRSMWKLETFYEFVVKWKEWREVELRKIESLAQVLDVNLKQMLLEKVKADIAE